MNVSVRFNIRATVSYLSVINLSLTPEALESGDGFCNYSHALRGRFPSIFLRGLQPLLRLEELKILSRLDVPRFASRPDDQRIRAPGIGELDEVLDYSGLELIRERIRALSDEDLEHQLAYIRKSMA